MLVKLAWQLDKVTRHRGTGHAFIGYVRQHLVQRMAKLVKQRPRIIIG